jgi:hypothetical protein
MICGLNFKNNKTMKNQLYTILLLLLSLNTFAQESVEFSISKVKGLMVSYDYSWTYLAQPKTQTAFFQPYHNLYIGGMGDIDELDAFGTIGFIFGTPSKDFSLLLNKTENLYSSKGYRIVSIAPSTLGVIGGKVQFMNEIAEKGLLSSYWYGELNYLAYRFKTTIQEGAFGYYNYREEKQSLNTFNFNMGMKLALIKFGGGIGIGWGLYNEGKSYSSPKENESITNNPKSKAHFMANVFLGISLDFISR